MIFVLGAGLGEVAHRAGAEEDGEHGARALHGVRDPGDGERLVDGLLDDVAGAVQMIVDLVGGQAQGGEPGGGGDRAAYER